MILNPRYWANCILISNMERDFSYVREMLFADKEDWTPDDRVKLFDLYAEYERYDRSIIYRLANAEGKKRHEELLACLEFALGIEMDMDYIEDISKRDDFLTLRKNALNKRYAP